MGVGHMLNPPQGTIPLQERKQHIAIQFNDPEVVIEQPERATFLLSYSELDPNEESRIIIPRDYTWAKQVWQHSVLKPYNAAMKKWHKGTGGGPGAPEDYSNWENRDQELFSGYAKSGRSDMLAWVYMKDKDTSYAFNTINNPSPQSAITEDSLEGESITALAKKSGKKTNGGIEHFGEMFANSMESGLTMIARCMETSNPRGREETGSNVSDTLTLITELEAQMERVEAAGSNCDEESGSRVAKRMKILQRAVDNAYDTLDNLT
jgi:hypothetical protein